ncbi:ADP-glyceromanno-heptose 6-epimerase [Cerasicoccus arenae]|uniref:ADP-L-glycero-D-manno-heptose-6-epimerase n=1 Tax=Cerasicoccus arenae TaxID=424488 RepID=A0A8J3DB65_9BACT|nr:ADP-glyceromanno-heptose 6-epimerase [Cerasicoccus arenae]MBK1858627.1 ADP-glyceromanno-heptose 6-epimerase [Cerasicoccus arenae]GHC04909.1 ADP-L-glycero-D-manno-heptose-6-epimerase [Cerasicoccus arenae]
MAKPKILVTGGAGFIGSALVWALNELGRDDILVADFLGEDEKWKNLVPLKFADYVEADELLELLEDDALTDIELVLHLGACSATTERDCRYLIQNNFEYTKSLASWALGRGARFVYASSAATYGDGAQGMDDQLEDLHALRPLNMYGYSKHLFDCYAQREGWLNKIVGLKYFNVYGPNEDHKGDMRSVVHKAFGQIRETGKVSLFKSYLPDYADGGQMRDFLYVKDAVAMTLHLAETSSANGLFNLGSGQANTWISLVTPIFTALNLPVNIEFIEMPDQLRGKYQYFTKADTTKLQGSGFAGCQYSLAEAVTDYVAQYLTPGRHLGD